MRAGRLTRLGHLYEAYGYSDQGFHVFLAEGRLKDAPSLAARALWSLKVSGFPA